jgi:hypothetical protein
MNLRFPPSPAALIRGPAAVAAALAAVAVYGLAQGIVFEDRDRNMVVRQLTSWNVDRVDESTIRFRGAGRPFAGAWRDQGLTMRGQTIRGVAQRNARGAFALTSATVEGSVEAVLTRTRAQETRVTTLTAPRVEYTASATESGATLSGPMSVVSAVAPTGERFELRGSAARLALTPLGERAAFPIRRATVDGPVNFSLLTTRQVREGPQTVRRPVRIDGRADLAVYDDAARTLTLRGNVNVEGDDTVIGGRAQADVAVVRLDEARQVAGIDLEGDPGTSVIRDRGLPR